MANIDIYSTETLEPPFNIEKLYELIEAGLTAGGFTIPPVIVPTITEADAVLYVFVPEGTYTQNQIDSIVAILNAVCVDPTRNQQTQAQVFAAYIAQNLQYKDVFAQASYVLETGIALLPTPPTLAAYRTVLTNTVTELVPLVGTSFETHFNLERAAQGLPVSLPINSMTLAQCGAFDNLLHIWLTARKVDALIAEASQE